MKTGSLSNFDLFFSLGRTPTCARFALISVDSTFLPKSLAFFSFIYSEIQIFSIFLNTAFLNLAFRSQWLKVVHYLHYISSIGDAIDSDTSPFLAKIFQIAACIYIFMLLCFSVYIFLLLKSQQTPGGFMQTLWRITCYLHPYVLFYPIHFTLIKIWSREQERLVNLDEIDSTTIVLGVFSTIAFVLNFLYCLAILICFQVCVKTTDPLSNKTNLINIFNLAFKTVYPFIWLFYPENLSILILISFNLCYSALRDRVHFYLLPYYNFSTLQLVTGLQAISTSFTFTSFVAALVLIANEEYSILSIILWLLMLPPFMKLYLNYLNRLTTSILLSPTITMNPYHALHHWHIYKYYSRYSLKPAGNSKVYKEKHLIYQAYLQKLQEENAEKSSVRYYLPTLSRDSLQTSNAGNLYSLRSELDYLRLALKRNPGNRLLKIGLILLYIKTNQMYLAADRHIQESLQSLTSFSLKNSLYMMKLSILKKLRTAKFEKDDKADKKEAYIEFIDVQEYIDNNEMLDVLKQKLRAQLKHQHSFWKEFKLPTVKLHTLVHLSKQIHKEANSVQSYWKYLHTSNKLNTPEPLIIIGLYNFLILENEVLAKSFIKNYFEFRSKDRSGGLEDGTIDNKVMKDVVWLAISGQPTEIGKVLRCSNRTDILGIKKNLVIGKSINVLIPSFLRQRHDGYLRLEAHPKPLSIMSKIRKISIVNSEGHLVLCHICVMLNFMPGIGLCYFALLQPIDKEKRLILFKEDGTISNYSKNLANDLNFEWDQNQKILNVFQFCPDLRSLVKGLVENTRSKMKESKRSIDKIGILTRSNRENLEYLSENSETRFFNHEPLAMIPNDHKLRFIPIKIPKIFRNEHHPEEIYYGAIIKVNSMEDGNMIEVVMNKLEAFKLSGSLTEKMRDRASSIKTDHTNNEFTHFTAQPEQVKPLSKNLFSRKNIILIKTESSNIPAEGTSLFDGGLLGKNCQDIWMEKNVSSDPLTEKPHIANLPKNKDHSLKTEELLSKKEETTHFASLLPTREDGSLLKREKIFEKRKIIRNNTKKLIPQIGDHNEPIELNNSYIPDQFSIESVSSQNRAISAANEASLDMDRITHQNHLAPRETSPSIAMNKDERAKKVIANLLQSRKLGKPSMIFIVIFLFSMLVTLGMMMWFSLHAPNVWNNIQIISLILKKLQLRTFATNLVNQEVRLGASMNTIANDMNVFPKTLVGVIGPDGTIPNSMKILNKYNMQLKDAVSYADEDIQSLFYGKNVRIFQRDENNNLILAGQGDTFQVLDQIISNGFYVASLPYPPAPLPELPRGFRFIFDNSVNDLLIVVEKVSNVLFNMIVDMCEVESQKNTAILTVSLLFLTFFLLISLNFIIRSNLEFSRFMNALLTLSRVDTENIREQVCEFDSLLAKEFDEDEYIKALQKMRIMTKQRKEGAKNDHGNRNRAKCNGILHKGSISGIYRQNFVLYLQILFAVILMVMCLVLFYIQSQKSISTINTKQIHMNTAFLNINQQSLISVQLQGMILDNDTTTLRNRPVEESLVFSINRLKEIDQLQKELQDSTGKLSQTQTDLLYHYECSMLATTLFDHLNPKAMNRKCLEITDGSDKVALTSLLPKMALQIEDLNDEFQKSQNRTESFIQNIYIKALTLFLSAIDVSVAMFAISYDATALSAETDLENLHRANMIMAVVASSVSVIMSILIWYLVIFRMITKQFDIKQTLSLIPKSLIIENAHLKTYIMTISTREPNEMKLLGRF